MSAEFGPFPEFSWSQSRRSTFRECPRKYYYQYYGSWKGWEEGADREVRAAYRLKQITNLHLVVGSVVHDLASQAILRVRGGNVPFTVGELIEMGRHRLNLAWVESQKRSEWERAPRSLTMLHEFYYGSGPAGDLIAGIREKLRLCLSNLLQAASYREALAAPFADVKEADRLDDFLLDGYKLYAQPDLLYRRGGGEYRLVDWKTGQESVLHQRQIRVYALYVRSRSDLEPGPITACLSYLSSGTDREFPITDEECDEARAEIRDSIAAMEGYLASTETYEPLPKKAFPLRQDTESCRSCKFFALDEEEIERAADQGPF